MKTKINSQYIWLGSLAILVTMLLVSIISYGAEGEKFSRIIFIALTNSALLISVLTSIYKPTISILSITFSQLFAVLDEIVQGYTFKMAVENVGFTFIIGLIAVVVFPTYIYINKTSKRDKVVNRLKEVLLYEREVLKVPIWCTFIIWCMFLTVLFITSNGELLRSYDDTTFRLYASAVLISPTFVYLSIYTTSSMIYQFYCMYIGIKLYTIYKLFIVHSLEWQSVLITLIEIIVVTVTIVFYIKNRKVEKKCKEKAQEKKSSNKKKASNTKKKGKSEKRS